MGDTLHVNKDFASPASARIFLSKNRSRLAGYDWEIRPLACGFGQREPRYEVVGMRSVAPAK